MPTPLISIVVPVFNAERFLRRCIDSILAQTYSNVEVLLINDGSSDNSGIICDEYAQKDNRVRVFHKENGGVSSSRNLGINAALGSWITFVDADDWLDSRAMSVCQEYLGDCDLVRFSSSFVYDCNCSKVKDINIEEFTTVYDYFTAVLCRRTAIQVWGVLYKLDIIKQNKITFDVELKNGEDWLFLMSYILCSTNVKSLNIPLYCYNVYNDSSCTNTMTSHKIFEGVSSFTKISRVLSQDVKYNESLFEGRISLVSFCTLGLLLLDQSSRELLMCRDKLFQTIQPFPTFTDVLCSKLGLLEKLSVLSIYTTPSFLLFRYMVKLYKLVF